MAEARKKPPKKLQHAILDKMVTLSTAGFGLVAALAWNSVVQELVKQYIQPLVGGSSGIWSLLIYALLVTLLAVLVTTSLARMSERLK